MTSLCRYCNATIINSINKVFCTSACSKRHKRLLDSEITPYISSINRILQQNRIIIKKLIGRQPTIKETGKVSKKLLEELHFNFEYFTSTGTNKRGGTYYYCYEYGYMPINNNWVILVKKRSQKEMALKTKPL